MFSSGGFSFGAGVVSAVGGDGWVWSQRSSKTGLNPAPASLAVPFDEFYQAKIFALRVVRESGWRVSIRRGRRTAGRWEAKVILPFGMRVADARSSLRLFL